MASTEDRVLSKSTVIEIISDVINKEGIINPVYEVSSGASKGDGYLSFITRVDVKGDNKTLHLIIKHAPKNEKMRELIPIKRIYSSEIAFYGIAAPLFEDFQKSMRVEAPFDSIAKCYKTICDDTHELLVLENIKTQGFQVHDKSKQMSPEQVKFVLCEYGKLHAVSFAMKKHAREKFDYIANNIEEAFTGENYREFHETYLRGVEQAQSIFDESTGIYKTLAELKENYMDYLISIIGAKRDYDVVIHGDCWCNNMMFKFKDGSSVPSEMRFFDFQITKIASPALDLAYFFYVSASQEMLDDLETYMRVYHDSLKEHLKKMNCDGDSEFPFAALKEEWKFCAKFGFLVSLILMKIMFREDDEISDLTDNKDVADTFMAESKNDGIIRERYRQLAMHCYHHGFL